MPKISLSAIDMSAVDMPMSVSAIDRQPENLKLQNFVFKKH